MHEFKLDGKLCQMAVEWSELSESQVLAIVPYLFSDRENPQVRKAVQHIIFPIKARLLKRMDPEDIFRFREFCTWIWEKPLQSTVITDFKFEGTEYLFPAANFEDVGLFEFAMADHYFRQFTKKTADFPALDNLIATICRPEKKDLDENDPEWDGDRREKYNSKLSDRRVLALARLPISIKIVVLQCFIAGQRKILTQYGPIFKKAEPGSGHSSGPDLGWIGTLYSLAEQGIFGDFDKTAFTKIHTVCFHLLKKHYDLKELERNS